MKKYADLGKFFALGEKDLHNAPFIQCNIENLKKRKESLRQGEKLYNIKELSKFDMPKEPTFLKPIGHMINKFHYRK